jgi:dTDP-4-amino-4,6-dideoxygalactose transaminase
MIPHSAATIGPEETAAVARVLVSGHLSQGREVQAFETECASFLGRRYAVATSSGTSALHLALNALGIGPDDLVAIPSYACAALSTAVRLQGASPLLYDVTSDLNLDWQRVTSTLSSKRAKISIFPHLFGKCELLPHRSDVIEDIAQSIGGPCGRNTIAAVASFYATKLLTTGEGGMVLTDDRGLADHVRDRRDYDNRDDAHLRYAYKMTDMQAAMGRLQLKRLPEFLERRREIANHYHSSFSGLPMVLPNPDNHVFFRYVVLTPRRDQLQRFLSETGIEAKRPVHRPAHHFFGGDFPHSERAHREALSLPIYPKLLEAELGHVIESVRRYWDSAS